MVHVTQTMIEQEKAMEATADSHGQLDTKEIYRIVRDLRAQQKDLDRERRAALETKKRADVVSLCATTLTLAAVAVLGVSFASGGSGETAGVSAGGSGVQEVKHDDAGAARRMETIIHLGLDVSEAEADKGEESYRQPLASQKSWQAGRSDAEELLRQGASAGTANEQQQHEQEEKVEDGGRELRHGRGFYRGNPNRNQNTRNNNNNLGTFSTQEEWERNCDQYLGRVDYDKFNNIRLRARNNGELKFQLTYESDGLIYRERFNPNFVIIAQDDRDTFMALEERAQFDCIDGECTVDRPAIVFRNCVGPTSTFSGNGGSELETFIFEDRPEDGFDSSSSSSSSDDRRDLRGGRTRNRGNRGNRNRRNGNGGNNNVRNDNDDDIARCDVYSCQVGQGVVFRPNSDSESRDWN